MRKEIVIGICLIAAVLMIAPTIPAQEYIQIKNAYDTTIQEQLHEIKTTLLTVRKRTDDPQILQQETVSTLTELKEIIENSDESSFAVSGFIINMIISLFFTLIGTVFGILFGPILSALVLLITSPAILLAKIIEFLLGGFTVVTE
jgi:predicted PurR-regulated permease PerM